MEFLQYFINGISIGSVYAMIALGYTMVYGIAKMLNFAHGDVIMVGGYICFCATVYLGLPTAVGILFAMIVCTILGVLIERLAYRPLRGTSSLAILITAIGVSYFLQNGAQLIWGADPKSFTSIVTLAFGEILKNMIGNIYIGKDSFGVHFALDPARIHLKDGGRMLVNGPMGSFGVEKIATFFMGFVLVMITLFAVLNQEGRAIQAIRDNRIAAESVGVNVTAFKLKAFAVSAILAGMAGALFGLNYSSITASQFGFTNSINILVFVVLGGMGNILGSVVSASVLYLLPEMLRGLDDFRMILYAVVLIVVMLCTRAPNVNGALRAVVTAMKDKILSLSKKRQEAAEND